MRRGTLFGKQAHSANNSSGNNLNHQNNQNNHGNNQQNNIHYNLPTFLQKKNPTNQDTSAKITQFTPAYDKENLYYQIFIHQNNIFDNNNNSNNNDDANNSSPSTASVLPPLPKAILLVNHSFASHCGQLETIGKRFSDSHFCVSMYDMRGCGRSGGKRGHMKHNVQSLVDMLTIVEKTRDHLYQLSGHSTLHQNNNQNSSQNSSQNGSGSGSGFEMPPVYLYGHGIGSVRQLQLALIVSVMRKHKQANSGHSNSSENGESSTMVREALDRNVLFPLLGWDLNGTKLDDDDELMLNHLHRLLLEFEPAIRGIVSTSPYLKVDFPNWQKKVVGFLAKRFQTYTIELDVNVTMLTSDLNMQKILLRDTLRVGDLTARNVMDLEKWINVLMMRDGGAVASQITLPILTLHGARDGVSDGTISQRLNEMLGSTDKTHYFLANFHHAIHLEVDREKAFDIVIKWLNERLGVSEQESALDHAESRLNQLVNEKIHKETVATVAAAAAASSSDGGGVVPVKPIKTLSDIALEDAAFELEDVEASTAATDENRDITTTDMTEPIGLTTHASSHSIMSPMSSTAASAATNATAAAADGNNNDVEADTNNAAAEDNNATTTNADAAAVSTTTAPPAANAVDNDATTANGSHGDDEGVTTADQVPVEQKNDEATDAHLDDQSSSQKNDAVQLDGSGKQDATANDHDSE